MIRLPRRLRPVLLLALLLPALSLSLLGQGALVPPEGPPAPTMKSLQEIWDQLETLDEATDTTIARQEALAARLEALAASQAQTQRFLTAISPPDALGWQLTTVGPNRANNYSTSLAFGPDGHPAIAYPGPNGLHFAQFDGTAWQIGAIYRVDDPRATDPKPDPSLGFGPDGLPIVAHVFNNLLPGISTFDGVRWRTDGLASSAFGLSPSLTFTPEGFASVAFSIGGGEPRLFTEVVRDSSAATISQNWTTAIVGGAQAGRTVSLAYGPDGQPAISYSHRASDEPLLARFDGSAWSQLLVAPLGELAVDTALAFGPDGHPAIAYDTGSRQLKLTRFNGVSWSATLVDPTGGAATVGGVSLAFGPDGHPAIAYRAFDDSSLRFARFDGATWSVAIIDTAGNTGLAPSLAFGPDGLPVIAYIDATNNTLKVARQGVFAPRP
jgi:hypothetical protein